MSLFQTMIDGTTICTLHCQDRQARANGPSLVGIMRSDFEHAHFGPPNWRRRWATTRKINSHRWNTSRSPTSALNAPVITNPSGRHRRDAGVELNLQLTTHPPESSVTSQHDAFAPRIRRHYPPLPVFGLNSLSKVRYRRVPGAGRT